jgi:methionine sulfoxide reductase heme-binding subunit
VLLPGPLRAQAGPVALRLTRTDLAAGALHAAVAAVATYALYRVIADSGQNDVMGSASALVSATGIAALAWSYAGLLLGLMVGTRLPRLLLRRRHRLLAWHRRLNLTVLGLMIAHIAAFAIGTPGGSWLVALVPQTSQVSAVGYTVGVLSLYAAVVLGPSYYLRRQLGPRVWLVAHQFAALVYALALWHALALGPNVRGDGLWRMVLWIAQIPVLTLVAARLWQPRRPSDRMDARLRNPRYGRPRFAVLRIAATTGVLAAAFIVLVVGLAAVGPGLHASGR